MPDAVLTPEQYRIEQARAERARQRDDEKWQTWRWYRMAMCLLVTWLITLGIVVWQGMTHRDVQAFVQVVHIEEGRIVQLGVPEKLLAYEPPESVYMDMLAQWVRAVQWRSHDSTVTKEQWAWAYRHTCGAAQQMLATKEERDKPFAGDSVIASVEIKSVTKTPAPQSYQVLYTERRIEKNMPSVRESTWTGTFTVGRYHPRAMSDILVNRLGVCVTAFDFSEQPSKGGI